MVDDVVMRIVRREHRGGVGMEGNCFFSPLKPTFP
jgi:hypothetical protein